MINQHPTCFIFPKTIDNESTRKEEVFSTKNHHKFKYKHYKSTPNSPDREKPYIKIIRLYLVSFIFNFYLIFSAHKKTPSSNEEGVFRNNELAMTYSHMGNPTLPSARRGFTSEFGKGSGGSLLLWSPAQLFTETCIGLIHDGDALRFPNL